MKIGSLAMTALMMTGCASMNQGSEQRFQDSVTSVTNEAPAQMSPPPLGSSVVDPTHLRTQADLHFALGDALSMDGNSNRAIEEFKQALIYDDKSATIRLRLAAEYVRKGMISEALDQTQQAIALDPNRVDGHLLLGGLYSAIRDHQKAMVSYRNVMKLDPDHQEAPVFLGALLAEEKRFDDALAEFQAFADRPSNKTPHVTYYYMGRLYGEMKGADAKAEAAYRKSLTLEPFFPEGTLALAELLLKTNRRAAALTTLRTYQDKYGPNAQVADHLGRMYMEDNDLEKAYAEFATLEAFDSDNINAKIKMALILMEQREFQKAVVKFEEVLAVAPNSDKVRFYLGAIYEELKNYPRAIHQFVQIPADSSLYGEAMIHASYLHKLQGQYNQAYQVIRQAIALKPDVAQFYTLYASLLDDQKETAKAITLMEGAAQRFPNDDQLLFYLGSLYEKVGNVEGVIAQMKAVLSLDPEHFQALNYLAYTYAENNLELDEAERLSRKALEFQPNDGYILDTLGWVLFRQGRTAEALRVLEIAYKLQPKESIIAEHLGDVYYSIQLPEKAKAMYQRAIEAESDAGNIQKLRSKVVSIENQQNPLALRREERKPASSQ